MSPEIAKIYKDIRQSIFNAKKELSNYTSSVGNRTDELEDATCEQSVKLSNRLADIENALCELSERIG